MKCLKTIAMILLIIGGLNWGLYGVFDFDVVEALFGVRTVAAKVIYDLVGLSAIYKIFSWHQHSCQCSK